MNPAAIRFHFQADNPDTRLVQGMNVSHTFPCHIHHSFSLGILQKGQRVIHMNGRSHIVSANEGFIINPYQPHACSMEGKGTHNYWIVSISPKLFQDTFREITGQEGTPCFSKVKITDAVIIDGLTTWLESQSLHKSFGRNEVSSFLKELVLRYADIEASVQPAKKKHVWIVTVVSKYIEANLHRTLRLHELADLTHISPFYLNRVFREEIGIPPYAYLVQTRVKKSLELLLRTGSITEVSYRLGFSDQSHFSRFFKKNVGITPGRYLDLHNAGIH